MDKGQDKKSASQLKTPQVWSPFKRKRNETNNL